MGEMDKLINLLTMAKVPFEVRDDIYGTPQVWYPNKENAICDVICHQGSYGYKEGLLEIMGLVDKEFVWGDDVEGHLTADQVAERIISDYRIAAKS